MILSEEANGELMTKCEQINDLEITVNSAFTLSANVLTAANKARGMLLFIKRSFTCPTKEIFVPQYTVRLLTHAHCKPTHLFFHSFIATMSYPLQTSFNSVMKDWADKYHVWGTPTRSPSRSNSR